MDNQWTNMILEVNAVVAQEDEEFGVYSINLGGVLADAQWLISIQLPLNITEQDVSLGHNTYAITTSTGATHYGGVLGWGFWSGGIFLDLDDEAVTTLGLERRVSFQTSEAQETNSTIEAGLTRILGPHA
jgi:hypothetical protein